jgi:hypothetical protein
MLSKGAIWVLTVGTIGFAGVGRLILRVMRPTPDNERTFSWAVFEDCWLDLFAGAVLAVVGAMARLAQGVAAKQLPASGATQLFNGFAMVGVMVVLYGASAVLAGREARPVGADADGWGAYTVNSQVLPTIVAMWCLYLAVRYAAVPLTGR